jgi:hypothetical protein
VLAATAEGKDLHRHQMEVECLKPSSCLGDCRSSCHRRTLGTAALAVVAPWGPPLVLPSPCLGDHCSCRCRALGTAALVVAAPWGLPLLLPSSLLCQKKADTVATPGGGHHRVGWRSSPSLPSRSIWWNRRRARSCRGSGVEASCGVRRRGRRPCPQEEGGSRALTWSPDIVTVNLLLTSLRRKNEMRR